MKTVTLNDLVDMLKSLPEDILLKEIDYLDLGHTTVEDLQELKYKLESSKADTIKECQN